jgi:hypothetical protein
MGKVGSSSIAHHLRGQLDNWEVFQIHTLTESGARRVEDRYRLASAIRSKSLLDRHILESRYLMSLPAEATKSPLKTISTVRDPVARNISAFFQTFEVDFAQKYLAAGENASLKDFEIDDMVKTFLYGSARFRHDYPLVWFEEELKQSLGIDIYAAPFDHKKQLQRCNNSRCDLLVMRMEDFPTSLAPSLEAFLGIKVGEVSRSNEGSKKQYANVYANFVDQIKLPEKYLDDMYGSRFARHFYTREEIERFRAHWSK